MNKRGTTEPITESITGTIIGVIILLALLALISLFIYLLFGSNLKCDNEAEWKALEKSLYSVDSSSFTTANLPFTNKGCILTSFSQAQPVDIFPGDSRLASKEPQLCLCKLESNKCMPFSCFKFAEYDRIEDADTAEQFHTANYNDYMFLTFTRYGKTLIIKKFGEAKSEFTYSYDIKSYPQPNPLDTSSLIQKLDITFTDSSIIGFLPVVSLKSKEPSGFVRNDIKEIPSAGSLPISFSIALATARKGSDPNNIASNIIKIDTSKVKEADFTFNMPNDAYLSLDEKARGDMRFYYKKDGKWTFIPLACIQEKENYICTAKIQGFFSDDFAITAYSGEKNE